MRKVGTPVPFSEFVEECRKCFEYARNHATTERQRQRIRREIGRIFDLLCHAFYPDAIPIADSALVPARIVSTIRDRMTRHVIRLAV